MVDHLDDLLQPNMQALRHVFGALAGPAYENVHK
jgi:hypothetical protein